MDLQLISSDGKAASGAGTVEVNAAAFGVDYNEALVHQVVTAYMAGGRAGTKAQKTRSEVRGGGAKPWRQKGTGRARAGTIRSPIWRSGGVTFAAKPRDYTQKVNRKMYRAAMRSIVSELVRQERLVVVEAFDLAEPKTKLMAQKLQGLGVDDALIVVEGHDERIELASRNLHWVGVIEARNVSPLSLLAFKKVVVTVAALKQLEERLG